MSKTPTVAGLVLNYNGREVTLETLSSLVQVDYPAFDIVMVDNGSSDGSSAAVAEAYPEVLQISVADNRGISWGLNHGIAWALEQGYDYVLLMNNDIEVAADFLTELVRAAEAEPSAGCLGPKSYYYFDRERLWSAGGLLRFRESVTRERGDGQIDRGQYDRQEVVPYINGCAMLVRRRALEQVGMWDPVYYLGVEDADFCVRLRQAGFVCVYVPSARLWHMISHSIGVYKPTRTYHTGRSSAIFLRKYGRPWHYLSVLAFACLAFPLAFLRELPKQNQAAVVQKWKGFLDGLRVELAPIPQPPRVEARLGRDLLGS
jgi:GT2 family glycosyltransferase